MVAGVLIREARRRAGLTQAELARRAATTQSAVARWETGGTQPDLPTVMRLVRLCGLDLEVAVVEPDDSDLAQARKLLALDPGARLERAVRTANTMRSLRAAGAGSARAT